MTFLRRARCWLTLVLFLTITGTLWTRLTFPVAVTLDFAYRGQHYHISYLTMMRPRFCRTKARACTLEWLPVRNVFSVPLRDGSLAVLSPYAFWTGTDTAAWMWLDNASAPTTIVLGNGGEEPSESDNAPFPTLIARATVERVSQFNQISAITSDHRHDQSDLILASSRFRRETTPTGQVFAEVVAMPLVFRESSGIRQSRDWVDLDGGCRILFRTLRNAEEANNAVAPDDPSQTRSLLRSLSKDGDVWSFDGKPGLRRPGVTYATGTRGASTGGAWDPELLRPAVHQLHNIKHDGKICHIAEWPKESFSAYIDFGDNQIFFVHTSFDWVMIRD